MNLRDGKLDFGKELIIEIAGKNGELPEKDIIREAILAVVHYIKNDLKKEAIPTDEFSEMLEAVLEGFGYHVKAIVKNGVREEKEMRETVCVNLDEIVSDNKNCYELFFFDQLAKTIKESLEKSPNVLYINGLQECVKKIVGVNKWTKKCSRLSDEIVCFARSQFEALSNKKKSGLVIK